MGMVVNMVDAVAVVAVAPGAVTEFQFRVGGICSAADSAFVGVIFLFGCALVRTAVFEDDDLRFLGWFFLEKAGNLHPPAKGEDIDDATAGEQKIITERHQREQAVGEQHYGVAHVEYIDGDQDQVQQRQDPGFHRDHEQNQELTVWIHGGEGSGSPSVS